MFLNEKELFTRRVNKAKEVLEMAVIAFSGVFIFAVMFGVFC